ncbi:rod shape-determining protein RodA [Leeuwenhoekiella palythoae]|uniref:Rod shape determining protein RodA n=1 Tax=Leeuwenhoekiella palythoae TaxID=573501 RepID=A0A1M5ZDK5_9FLAO|nr:rod shape-determining protein RodA [Leeuwenhoekiella palythoae]MEC7782707.1 rod shape-determining protein RodA [Bacteroidota bacterium]HBO28358.1 rod shape-determining protein RodA [Leeuwenhoekiella sp.]MEE3148680.1 rod shape-determining protein RodA [Bacteroidota bacterium]RXG28002.1 rod shape determining protein RodA [Leeuwenhoekiella palythoae]UBZ09277.1 rod shape-determining protein RodA [Leeuwenhoekiella palythoae]|tara:strand:+ start:153 stop:1418 length:1266 start_codon:yes stop_codon:yes gene_type:complete
MRSTARNARNNFDWLLIVIYLALVGIGWVNIYSASIDPSGVSNFFDLSNLYTKQLLFIALSLLLIVFILSLEAKFFERFASVIYVVSIASLLGLFVFGKNISGATSWYAFGSFSLQPSEFAKAATALALAKYLSDIQTDVKSFTHQFRAFIIIALPALCIVPQPDPGSALVYAAFFFPLYREGLSGIYLITGSITIALFVLTLAFGPVYIIAGIVLIAIILLIKNRKKRFGKRYFYILPIVSILFVLSVNYIFQNVFEQRHRDRFNVVLGKDVDMKSIGYNTYQSEIAIGNGGLTGKGFLKGTQTKGNFVPEQHTDYIFSTVGEEWGFLGSTLVILLFVGLMLRIIILSERQKSQFSRIYGYSIAGILFIHFLVNIGMVTGVFPTVGIPLPFFSYGGSGLWGFTILLFIFIKLDSNRVNEW